MVEKLFPDPCLGNQNRAYLWINCGNELSWLLSLNFAFASVAEEWLVSFNTRKTLSLK